MFDFAEYHCRPRQMERGDILAIYSDGLTDAEGPRGEMFREKRPLKIIQEVAPSGTRAVEQGLLKEINDFTQDMPQRTTSLLRSARKLTE